ncbi:MAG: aquaporin family protein [Gammaproteobacteria bacterium]|nr:aquaporin family protein [Gammaproteobacteria bacterium]
MVPEYNQARKFTAEALGTCFLLMTVVGSGVMSSNLSGGSEGLALLGNTIPTGAILVVLIVWFGPISGAHLNPAVSLAFVIRQELGAKQFAFYLAAQISGAIAGVLIAHAMFGLPPIEMSSTNRSGNGQFLSEIIATFGLVGLILGTVKNRPDAVPYVVGLYITAAYWFTASTSFANPAVTLARSFTESFSGIRFSDVGLFIFAQIIGAVAATLLWEWLNRKTSS